MLIICLFTFDYCLYWLSTCQHLETSFLMLIHVVFVLFWWVFIYICLLCVLSAKTIQTKFDASTLHSNQQLAAETQMFDDGSGRVEVCTTFIGDYFNGFNFQKKPESKVVSTNILVFC